MNTARPKIDRRVRPRRQMVATSGLDALTHRGYQVLGSARAVKVVVGPTGVFAIDNEPGGESGAGPAVGRARQVALDILAAIERHPDGIGVSAVPIVCAREARRQFVRGVAICAERDLVDAVTSRARLLDDETVVTLSQVVCSKLGYGA